jgi:hypothetical protein
VSDFLMMPVDAVRPHPRHSDIFGAPTAQSIETVRASIMAKGIVTPCLITPADAEENPSCLVDGHRRLVIARELGFTESPVVIDPTLQTEVVQVERLFDVAQRADFTPRERARQAAAFRTYLASIPLDERRKRYGNKGPTAIVAMVVSRNRNDVHHLEVVYSSASSTNELKIAVDTGRIPLRVAHRIIVTAEGRREPGTPNARHLVNQLLQQALDSRANGKHRRAPRTPTFNPTPKPPSFLVDMQRQVLDWVLGQMPAKLRDGSVQSAPFQAAVRDLMVEIRAVTAAFRARVRRLGTLNADQGSKRHSILALNESLHVLNLQPVKRIDDVDLGEVRRTHRLLARAYHPDINDTKGASEEFHRVQGAYEEVLAICDR